jgi:hypothetical protein
VLIWCGIVLGMTIYTFLLPWVHSVYGIYSAASRQWWAGEDMYVRANEYYRYSPLFAVVLTPLAQLPESWGGALWKVINCGVYALGLGALVRKVVPVSLTRNQIAGLFLLALPLSLHSMYNSQANLMMLGACLLGLAAAAQGRWSWAAGWIAWATLIKGYPLALALLLMGLYPRRFLLRYALALAIGLVLPFAAQRPAVVLAQYTSWLGHIFESTEVMRERLRSIDHLFVLYAEPLSHRTFALMGLASGLVVFGLCRLCAWTTADVRERLTRTFVLFAIWVVLVGPATETCTYVVVAPAIAWSIVDLFRRPAPAALRWLLIASLVLMGPAVTDFVGPAVRNFANAHGSQTIGALIYLVYLLAQTGQRCAAPALAVPAGDITLARAA